MPHNRYIIQPTRRATQYVHDHFTVVWVTVVIVALLCIVGFQAYAYQINKRNTQTAEIVKQLTKGQCANTRFTFKLFNDLATDTSPHFGSGGGKIIPGERTRSINHLYRVERDAAKDLAKQGCIVTVPRDIHD